MSDLVCTLFWLLGLLSHDGNFESPDHYNENKCYNTRALGSRLFSAHNPGLGLAAGGGSSALIGPDRLGPRPRRDPESRVWPLCVSQAAPDIGSVLENISSCFKYFYVRTWPRNLIQRVNRESEICGARKVFQCFPVEGSVRCLEWYWASEWVCHHNPLPWPNLTNMEQ